MLLLLIVFAPLFGAIISGFFGSFIGRHGSFVMSFTSVFVSFICSIITGYQVITQNQSIFLSLAPWINSGLFFLHWNFFFDTLTIVMIIIITSISTLVHLYSYEYMAADPHLSRFMAYLSFFTFYMLVLVTSGNLLQMFVGWEGVGLCSYLLINFWFTRLQANKAAIKAMLVNRVSDVFMILGLLVLFISFKTLNYLELFAIVPSFTDEIYTLNFFNITCNLIDLACFFLLLGAMGKSAQLFLHTWLPDAMEGPTPVSALIHAATMVTAGIFLVGRCSLLFENSPIILNMMVIIGAMTAFFAGTVGLVQNDLKKVIAYSTCSQLGYMFFACGVSNYNLGIFHLSNHAFFKALLFLSAGSVIHALSDEQDMRKMGGLRRILPYTYSMFIIGSLSLMGFPFLTGFYSKDAILEVSYACHTTVGHFAYWLGTLAAICTAFYSTRLIFLTFLKETNTYKSSILNAHDAPFCMAFPLSLLSFGSIFIGYLCKDMFIGLGTDFWSNSLFIYPSNINIIDAEFLPTVYKILPIICSLISVSIAFKFYTSSIRFVYNMKTSNLGLFLYTFLNRKWFFDKVYNEFINQSLLHFSYWTTYKLIDRGLIEHWGPKGIGTFLNKYSILLNNLHTGLIYNYATIFAISIGLLLFIVLNNLHIFWLFLFLIFLLDPTKKVGK